LGLFSSPSKLMKKCTFPEKTKTEIIRHISNNNTKAK